MKKKKQNPKKIILKNTFLINKTARQLKRSSHPDSAPDTGSGMYFLSSPQRSGRDVSLISSQISFNLAVKLLERLKILRTYVRMCE